MSGRTNGFLAQLSVRILSVIGFAVAGYFLGYYMTRLAMAVRAKQAPVTIEAARKQWLDSKREKVADEHPGPVDNASANSYSDRMSAALRTQQWAELERLLSEWVHRNPYDALEWALGLSKPYQTEAIREVLLEWLKIDPEEAWRWLLQTQSVVDILNDNRFYETVIEIGRPDLGIQGISGFEHKYFLLTKFSAIWAENDRAGMMDYLAQLESTRQDWQSAASGMVSAWGRTDLQGTLDWITANAQQGYEQRLLVEAVAKGMIASGQAQDVQVWLASVAPTSTLNGAYRAMAEYYATSDPQQAYDWLRKIDDPQFIAGTYLVIADLSRTRPDLAVQIVQYIPDQVNRDQRIALIVNRWAQTDLEGAINYLLQSTALSTDKRSELLNKLNAAAAPGSPKG